MPVKAAEHTIRNLKNSEEPSRSSLTSLLVDHVMSVTQLVSKQVVTKFFYTFKMEPPSQSKCSPCLSLFYLVCYTTLYCLIWLKCMALLYCKTWNICGRKILQFFYFEVFAGVNLSGFLTPGKIGLIDGNRCVGWQICVFWLTEKLFLKNSFKRKFHVFQ